jgi:transposase
MEGLAALVREAMGGDPFSGTVYVFRAKRADRVKLILWDGTGMVLVAKRLEDGKFRWPGVQDAIMRLSAAELQALLEGLDWRRVHEPRNGGADSEELTRVAQNGRKLQTPVIRCRGERTSRRPA